MAGELARMSIPTSAIAARTPGLMPDTGSEPPTGRLRSNAKVGEPAEGHLRASGVVHTQEENRWQLVGCRALGVGQGLQALAGKSFCANYQPSGDGGGRGQLVVTVEQERLDRLLAEDAAELGVQVSGCAAQAHSSACVMAWLALGALSLLRCG